MTTLAALISRLEKLDGPDREVDQLIAGAVLNPAGDVHIEGIPNGSPGLKTWFYPDGTRGTSLQYTRSLDAAMTLVPENAYVDLSVGKALGKYSAKVHIATAPGKPLEHYHGKASLFESKQEAAAVSICIAALKARTAEQEAG